ncbi:MAG: hypothetical protein ABL918_04340 [Chakrabartia sp.]
MSSLVKSGGITTAAVMFAFATLANAAPAPEGSTGKAISGTETVHCYGVHSCKGNSDCKTTGNECKGLNVCKGHGFKAMTASACLKGNGTIGDIG